MRGSSVSVVTDRSDKLFLLVDAGVLRGRGSSVSVVTDRSDRLFLLVDAG